MIRFLTLLILLSLCILQLPAAQPLMVELATDDQRTPVYVGYSTAENSEFSPDYVRQLDHILRFDLSHNGSSVCVETSSKLDALAAQHRFMDPAWNSSGAMCVISSSIQGKEYSVVLGSTNDTWTKSLAGVQLKGDLASDRRQIHLIADAIHNALFDTPGIASTKILYTVRAPAAKPNTWNSEVWESDYDGANARQITKDSGYSISPVYIPPTPGKASSAFIYVSYKNGQPKLFLSPLKEFNEQRLSLLRGNQLMPAISRQRDKIAFISDATGNPDLFVQNFSSEKGPLDKPYQAFATHRATQGSPVFSPDGKKIAFVSNKDGNPRIYVIELSNLSPGNPLKTAKLISRTCRENSAPSWSPDGSKIAYCSMTDGVRQIWVYDYATDEEAQATNGPIHKENPSWAPNSKVLVYNTNSNEGGELFLLDLAMPIPTHLPLGMGQKRFPSWEPR